MVLGHSVVGSDPTSSPPDLAIAAFITIRLHFGSDTKNTGTKLQEQRQLRQQEWADGTAPGKLLKHTAGSDSTVPGWKL